MKEIKLISLHLENFKGIREKTFTPGGMGAEIRGDNATGKTTLYDAFVYLLFDKDSQENSVKSFSIKTTDEKDQVIHGIDHIVEAELLINGEPLKLKKNYREVWSKKKKVLKSHKTDYWIDDLPDVLKKDYDKKIAGLVSPEMFKLLTSVTAFSSMKWEARRKILFQLCVGLTEDALGNAEKKKKILASKKKKINEQKDEIRPRIDELHRGIVLVADYDQAGIKARIADLDKQIQTIKTDSSRFALLKEQGELEAKLSQIKAGQEKEKQEATGGIRAEIEEIEDDYAKAKKIIHNIEFDINWQTDTLGDAEAKIEDLYSEWDNLITDEPDILDFCPTCQKPFLPEEKESVRADFNLQQSKRKEGINQAGKEARNKLTAATEEKINLKVKLKAEQMNLEKIERDLEKKRTELDEVQLGPLILSQEITETAARVRGIEDLLSQQDQQHDTKILESDLAIERAKIARIDAGEEHKIRIVELGEQEKALSAEIERLEADLFKAEENIQDQARLLEIPINAKFGLVKFQLFEKQMNLGVRPCCKTLVDGIEWGHGANTGNEMLGGCDIISTLQRHYGILCPVWVDNKESLSSDIKMDCQVISLIMDPQYKKLEITIDE